MTIRYLTLRQVLLGAEVILGATSVPDMGLLDSAVGRPASSAFGADAYPSVFEKAAALLHSIVSSRPFTDGNKRMGWASAVAFLELNGQTSGHTEDEAFDLVMAVADGSLGDVSKIAERLESFCS